jgi:hypothetical protein
MTNFVRIPPDSTGKMIYAKEHGDTFVQGVHLVDRDDPTIGQRVDNKGAAYTTFADGSPQFDAFGRMVSSQVKAAFTLDFSCKCDPRGVSNVLTGGGAWVVEDSGALMLSTDTVLGSSASVQTDEYYRYTAGFSTSLVFTMSCGDSGKEGVVRRVGAFDLEDGIFFQIDENGLNVVIRNSINSSERVISRQDFNGDKLDGTGISGLDVDLTKDNIYWIDYQWLGAGAVSFGMFANGEKVLLHREGHFNQLNHSYMVSGSRPFRIEQTNTGTPASGSEFRLFCLSVITDDSSEPVKFDRTSPLTISETYDTANDVHMVSIRPKQFNSSGVVNRRKVGIPEAMISGISETKGVFLVKLIANAEIVGGTWDSSNNIVEINTGATITGGVEVNQRLVKTDGDVMELFRGNEAPLIKRKADSNETETLSLVFKRLRGGSIDVDASFIIADGV